MPEAALREAPKARLTACQNAGRTRRAAAIVLLPPRAGFQQEASENMRTLTEHQINECNQAITITADEPDPKNGNASHLYDVTWQERDDSGMHVEIQFQHGPIAEVGTNGLTHEVLLAILADRLRGFQSGPYACQENADALVAIELAQQCLHSRTRKRVERGVEGTHTV